MSSDERSNLGSCRLVAANDRHGAVASQNPPFQALDRDAGAGVAHAAKWNGRKRPIVPTATVGATSRPIFAAHIAEMLTVSPVDPEPASKLNPGLNPGRPTRQIRVISTLVVGSSGQAATQHSKSSSSRPAKPVRRAAFPGQGQAGQGPVRSRAYDGAAPHRVIPGARRSRRRCRRPRVPPGDEQSHRARASLYLPLPPRFIGVSAFN
jgi:hypothetical protein